MSAIYAIIPAAEVETINAVGVALKRGPWFSGQLTDDPSPSPASGVTHYHMYDATAKATDFSDLVAAKAGLALPLDFYGDPVVWGEGGAPSEADAFAAFATMQLWANDSTREPADFADEQRVALGLNEWSPI